MGVLNPVDLTKGNIGPNILGSNDGIAGLIMHGVAVGGSIALGETKEIFKLSDAEALGLDADYDTTNEIQVWYHIKEFYRMIRKITGRESSRLYIMLIDNSVTATELDVTMEDIVEDAGGTMAQKLIEDAEGKIRWLGVAMNPAATYASTQLDGLDADVVNAIPKAQLLADWAWGSDQPLNIILEGREFNGTAAAAGDLRAIDGVKAENVSVAILQDYAYAEDLVALQQVHAAVGTILGVRAALRVHENIGEVERCNIEDILKDAFTKVGLSNHELVSANLSELDTLDAKGYIFAYRYTNYDGVFINNDHTCTPIELDAEGNKNLHQMAYGAVVGKAKRVLRNALLPKVKTTQDIDATTGKLSTGAIKYFEGIGNTELNRMQTDGEISGGATYVDPDSDLLNPPRVLNVDFAVVPRGTVDEISGNINLKASL